MIGILAAGGLALLLSLLGTPVVTGVFRRLGTGQPIRSDGPQQHTVKAGTPTMGGLAIVTAIVVAWAVAHLLPSVQMTRAGMLAVGVLLATAALGATDDIVKVRDRNSGGLRPSVKFAGQAAVATAVAIVGPRWAGLPQQLTVTGDIAIPLPTVVFIVWMFVLISGVSNAVNLTDGLDGLAAGTSVLVFGALTLVAFWQYRNPIAFGLTGDLQPLDIAVLCSAAVGACAGFLWHNAPPARIFMGDTGSLALGGMLAAVATITGTQLLLVLIGALFVAETASVIVQVAVFKLTKRSVAAGRRTEPLRVLRMTPLHHHFELCGWQETTIIVRLWIAAGIGVAAGLGVFYSESLGRVIDVIRSGVVCC